MESCTKMNFTLTALLPQDANVKRKTFEDDDQQNPEYAKSLQNIIQKVQ